ncbi:MAG: HIT family protein [Actinomycetota bacterium]|nr:HIT family protein [Actinomycetota bacterium]
MTDSSCPFCSFDGDWVLECPSFTALLDRFPVSEGHTLVIPRLHVNSFFDLGQKELAELMPFVGSVIEVLKKTFEIDGYNIGINGGASAGQTLDHAHLHIIPRYSGDSDDPRGGVRHVFPDKAKYW